MVAIMVIQLDKFIEIHRKPIFRLGRLLKQAELWFSS